MDTARPLCPSFIDSRNDAPFLSPHLAAAWLDAHAQSVGGASVIGHPLLASCDHKVGFWSRGCSAPRSTSAWVTGYGFAIEDLRAARHAMSCFFAEARVQHGRA